MTLFAVFIIHWASLQNFRQNFFLSKKPYFEAKLVNRCLLHERFFAIEVLGQPEKFYFQNSKSKIFVKEGNKIQKYLVEIKPKRQVSEPKVPKRKTKGYIYEVKEYVKNQAKWKSAQEFCEDRQWKFKIMTEDDLGIRQ